MRTEMTTISRDNISKHDDIASVDYKAAPHEVLKVIDRLLAEEGLEVVMMETGGDDYIFSIEVRQ